MAPLGMVEPVTKGLPVPHRSTSPQPVDAPLRSPHHRATGRPR